MDLFAAALWELFQTGEARLEVERDDGYIDEEELSWYLTSFRSFPRFEKQALRFAAGHVLDLGCGAGRHSLYLQRHGLAVTAVDASPPMAALARVRGVRDVRITSACRRLPFEQGEFDTVLLFGNNLGLCGTPARVRRMLRELARVTSRQARILATSRSPDVKDAAQRAHVLKNIRNGRPPGQNRLRLSWKGQRGEWFDLLLFSPLDLMQLALREGWVLEELYSDGQEEGYAVVLAKAPTSSWRPGN